MDRYKRKQINKSTAWSIIEDYFEPKNLDILPKDEELNFYLSQTEGISKLSFAELDLIEAFEKGGVKLENIFKRIEYTSNKGEKYEESFEEFLRSSGRIVTEYQRFDLLGNVVDTKLGIDLFAVIGGKKVAIQVKPSEEKAKYAPIRKLGIPYLSVYPHLDDFKYFAKNDTKSYSLKNLLERQNRKIDKEEQKEGVGAYAAPAFEMQPDHTTFKNKSDYQPTFIKQTKLQESSTLFRRLNKVELDRTFDDAIHFFFRDRIKSESPDSINFEQFRLTIITDLIEMNQGKIKSLLAEKNTSIKDIYDILYELYSDRLSTIYERNFN